MNPPESVPPGAVPPETVRYCGRTFTATELAVLRELAATLPTRRAIADAACDTLGWTRPDGRRKDMSARVALIPMAQDKLITLPPPRTGNANRRWPLHLAATTEPFPIHAPLAQLRPLRIRLVGTTAESKTWNTQVATHHYLGYSPLPGAQLRYLIESDTHGILALAGFGASAWKCAARDTHPGWDPTTREANLHLVVGNARFLICPHVHVPHLASHVLPALTRRLPADWQDTYSYTPVLAETFVERDRFAGTSYKAANWIHVGHTTGAGKLDRHHKHELPIKDVYLYPLHRAYPNILTNSS